MMSHKVKWLFVIQLLLSEQALCRLPPPPTPRLTQLPGPDFHKELEDTAQLQPGPVAGQPQERIQSATQILSVLKAKLQGQIHVQGNISCQDLLSASTMDPPSFTLPLELLGLALVPVLVAADCPKEAQVLMLRLYDLLGVADAEELLMELETLIERRAGTSASVPTPALPSERARAGHHIDAVMFNIQQLVSAGEGTLTQEGRCEGWTRVSGATLVGAAVEGSSGGLEEALSSCERLGALCAGVSSVGPHQPQMYQALLQKGSRILPSSAPASQCWIRQCGEEGVPSPAASGRRMKRSSRSCINKSEERVYSVVEWIPTVSTLYNLGTAVYYASVNCSETAKERAILTAVDLGTDALMVATGGAAGVAGYALGAGVKTSVKAGMKYLFDSMRSEEDDVLVNQFPLQDDSITIQ